MLAMAPPGPEPTRHRASPGEREVQGMSMEGGLKKAAGVPGLEARALEW